MKKIAFFLLASSLLLVNCSSHDDVTASEPNVPLDQTAIKANAEKLFGTIDPSQNWSSTSQGVVNIVADANLNDIVKVQILTESPFANTDAAVLNEATVKKGDAVKLIYDAPNIYDVLFAACVDSKGKYYVKAFNVGQNEVSFAASASSRMTRADGDTYPSLSSIVLGEPVKSFNALRAEASQAEGYVLVNDDSKNANGGAKRRYTEWSDGTWLNDYLWAPVAATDGAWTIADGTIYKKITEKVDMTTMQWLVKYYLKKTDGEIVSTISNKSNNWKSIVEGSNYFKKFENHFVSNGEPLTIVPLQMNTTEGQYNNIYYYYFDPAKTEGMTAEQEANYIKALPKFKAIVGYKGGEGFKREKEYLLPYYGDGAIASGSSPVALSIPKGYYIGFLNHKANGTSYNYCMNGCTYGYGPLNKENNHLVGHFFSAMSTDLSQESVKDMGTKTETQTKNGTVPFGMTWDSPRIGIFTANNEAFMCFEDGADCNFSDMIIEITGGVEVFDDPIDPDAAAYTMCFEDEPETADYDMNDVVLRAVRLNDNQIEVSLIACGAYDELYITGLNQLGKKEVHKLFKLETQKEFVNTVIGSNYIKPVSEKFNINTSVSIEDFLKKITIVNKTTGKTIAIPKNGEPPYAIIVPLNFRYPKEKCSIINAYPTFKNWAQNRTANTDWYKYGVEGNLYPNMFDVEE